MTTAPSTSPDSIGTVRWGMGDAIGGWALAYTASLLIGTLLLLAFGHDLSNTSTADLSMVEVALQTPPLWLGFLGVPIWAAAVKGNGWIRDFHVAIRWTDVPLGLVVGTIGQLVIVPLISWPVLELTGKTTDDLSESARQLGDKATTPLGAVLLVLLVVIGAPIAEELFFRGLLFRSATKTWGVVAGVIVSSVAFGLTHFQPLALPALTAAGLLFALLVVWTDRLGPAIVAHMAFNAVTVVSLLAGWA